MAFHNLNYKAYPREKRNTSKRVVRNKELPLTTPEEKDAALGKQEVTNCRRIIIKKG